MGVACRWGVQVGGSGICVPLSPRWEKGTGGGASPTGTSYMYVLTLKMYFTYINTSIKANFY